jgi:hypothetical protein
MDMKRILPLDEQKMKSKCSLDEKLPNHLTKLYKKVSFCLLSVRRRGSDDLHKEEYVTTTDCSTRFIAHRLGGAGFQIAVFCSVAVSHLPFNSHALDFSSDFLLESLCKSRE